MSESQVHGVYVEINDKPGKFTVGFEHVVFTEYGHGDMYQFSHSVVRQAVLKLARQRNIPSAMSPDEVADAFLDFAAHLKGLVINKMKLVTGDVITTTMPAFATKPVIDKENDFAYLSPKFKQWWTATDGLELDVGAVQTALGFPFEPWKGKEDVLLSAIYATLGSVPKGL